eukprot:47512-Eustigmatos_ZCMA.PRE.1
MGEVHVRQAQSSPSVVFNISGIRPNNLRYANSHGRNVERQAKVAQSPCMQHAFDELTTPVIEHEHNRCVVHAR